MIHRGLVPVPKLTNRIEKRYEELKNWAPSRTQKHSPVVPEAVEKKSYIVVQSDLFLQTLTDIDHDLECLNRGDEADVKIKLTNITPKDLKLIITYLKTVKKEYEGIDSLDPEYKACYPGKRITNRVLTFIDEQITKIEDFNKASKLPTFSKPQPASKQVAGMKCMKDWNEFKSIPLEKIVGAKAILLFNTKYRKIMYLEAKTTFQCKGAAFYEVEKWTCRTARKPESQLKDWMAMTKPQLKAAIDSIAGANSAPQVRIGDDTLFLREWR
jgi:hypothetical protein